MSGDVQGDTSKVISNQSGADINTDGNDKKILVEDGAEKQTDDADEIKTIPNSEYMELSKEEKAKYVLYNPGLQDKVFYEWLAMQSQLVNGFNQLGPAIEKLQVLENIQFLTAIATNLSSIASAVEAVPESIAGLSSALSKVGLGKLVEIITSLAQGIGALCALVVANMVNPFANMEAYYKAWQETDFSSLETLLLPQPGTPSIATLIARQQAQLNAVHIPSEEIKNKITEQGNAISSQLSDIGAAWDSIKVVDSLLASVDEVDRLLEVAGSIMSFGVAGIAKEAYKQQFAVSYNKLKIDYQEKAKKLTEKFTKFQSELPLEWILKTDLEKLKTMTKAVKQYEDEYNSVVFPKVTTDYYSSITNSFDSEGHLLKKYWRTTEEEGEYPVKLETIQVTVDEEGKEKKKVLKTEFYKKNETTGEYELQTMEKAQEQVATLGELRDDKERLFTEMRVKLDEYYDLKVNELELLHLLEDETLTPAKRAEYNNKYLANHQALVTKTDEIFATRNEINRKKRNEFKPIWTESDEKVLDKYIETYETYEDLEYEDIHPNNS